MLVGMAERRRVKKKASRKPKQAKAKCARKGAASSLKRVA